MRKLLIGLVVVLGLLVVADRGAELYAERAIADRISAELDQRPDVEIEGFSFLLQAVQGDYDRIAVSGSRASQSGLGVSDFRAELEGVQLPLSDVLQGSVQRVPTRLIRGSALLRFDDVAEVVGNGISLDGDGEGRVRVTASADVLGQEVEVTAVSEVRIEGGALVVRAVSYEAGGQEVTSVSNDVLDLLDFRVPLPSLPYDLTVEDLSVTGDGIRLAASVRGVVLTR